VKTVWNLLGLKQMVDQYYIIVNHVIYGLIVRLGYGYTLMERSIMGKLSKQAVKHNIDELIENLTQCNEGDDCRRCKSRNECLRHTRNILAWVLDVFGNRIEIDESRSGEQYL